MLQGEHSAILPTFIKLPFVTKTFVLSIFEWPFYTGFTKESILQYFRPSLSYNLSLRPLFCLFLSGRFTQVLLYVNR